MAQIEPIAGMLLSGDSDQQAQARELLRVLPELRAPAEALVIARVASLEALVEMSPGDKDLLMARFGLLAATRAGERLPVGVRPWMRNMLLSARLLVDGHMERDAFYRQFPTHRILPSAPQLDELWKLTMLTLGMGGWRQSIALQEVMSRFVRIAVKMARAHTTVEAECDDSVLLGVPRRHRRARIAKLAHTAGEAAREEEAAAQRADLGALATALVAAMLRE